MKRLCCLLVVCLLLLTGCTAPVETPPVTGTKVTVTLKAADLTADPPTVTVTWHNPLQDTVRVSNVFDILRIGEDGLTSCFDVTHEYADASFTYRSYELMPQSTLEHTYNVAAYILPRDEELRFQAQYTAADMSFNGIAAMAFKVKDDSTCEEIPTDGELCTPPLGGYVPNGDELDSRFYLTLDRQATEDGYTSLDVTLHNDSPFDAWYGEPYDVDYFDGSEWVSTITDENACWTMPAFLLPAHGTSQKTYTPDRYGLFDLSKAGRYRLSTTVTYGFREEHNLPLTLTVEFTVE